MYFKKATFANDAMCAKYITNNIYFLWYVIRV